MDCSKSCDKVLSKNKIKLIRSLSLKKNRLVAGLFVAEGKKIVFDLIQVKTNISEVFCTESTAYELAKYQQQFKIEIVSREDLAKISFLKTPPEIVALFEIPKPEIDWNEMKNELTLILDSIQDPGNLGTIIRLSDWFGIKNIICSEESVDLYNPKVIQSTMGAFARVKVHYGTLPEILTHALELNIPVYGTFLEGENLYQSDLTSNGMIVMGNEGNGICELVESFVTRKIFIPSYPQGAATSESLNVAVATAVICAEFRRRAIYKD